MNFCSSPALPSFASQALAGEGSRSRPAGRGVCSPGCRHGLPLWLLAGWVNGFFPCPFCFSWSCLFRRLHPASPGSRLAFKGSAGALALASRCRLRGQLWQPCCRWRGRWSCSQTNLSTGIIAGLGKTTPQPLWAVVFPPVARDPSWLCGAHPAPTQPLSWGSPQPAPPPNTPHKEGFLLQPHQAGDRILCHPLPRQQ